MSRCSLVGMKNQSIHVDTTLGAASEFRFLANDLEGLPIEQPIAVNSPTGLQTLTRRCLDATCNATSAEKVPDGVVWIEAVGGPRYNFRILLPSETVDAHALFRTVILLHGEVPAAARPGRTSCREPAVPRSRHECSRRRHAARASVQELPFAVTFTAQCRRNFYAIQGHCFRCPIGTACHSERSDAVPDAPLSFEQTPTLTKLQLEPNFWRLTDQASQMRACVVSAAPVAPRPPTSRGVDLPFLNGMPPVAQPLAPTRLPPP